MTRTLIIDSDAAGRSATAHVFEDLGNEVFLAASPEEGLRAAFAARPGAILVHTGVASGRAESIPVGVRAEDASSIGSLAALDHRTSCAATGELVQRLLAMHSARTMPVIAYSRGSLAPSDSRLLFEAGVSAIVPVSQVGLLPEIVAHHLRLLQLAREGAVAFSRLRDDFHKLQRRLQKWVDTAVQGDVDRSEIVLNEIIAARPDGVLVVGADGKVLNADAGAEAMLGGAVSEGAVSGGAASAGTVTGRSIGALVPASRLSAFLDAAGPGLRDRIAFDVPQLSHRPPRRVLASVVGLGSNDDSDRQRLVLLVDLSHRQRVEQMADAESAMSLPASYQLRLLEHAHERCSLDALPRESAAARRLHMALTAASRNLRPVLLRGRPESARSRYAEILHHARRMPGPVLEVACDGLSTASQEIELFGERAAEGRSRLPGAIALADGGTLVLHEVHCLSVACQERLASVAKDPHIRLIATIDSGSTARVPDDDGGSKNAELVPSLAGAFAGLAIDIPPLSAMREDLPGIIADGIGLGTYLHLTTEARGALLFWDWPQDRRELDLELAHIRTIRGRSIGLADLSSAIASAFTAACRERLPEVGSEVGSESVSEAGSDAQDAAGDSRELGWVELAPHAGRNSRPSPQHPFSDESAPRVSSQQDPSKQDPSKQGSPAYRHSESTYSAAPRNRAGSNGWVPTVGEWTITEEDPIDLNHYERKVILRALNAAGGNRTRAAEVLGVGKSTFYRKLAKLGLR